MRINPDKKFGTRECPGCACEVERNNNRCPVCGYEFPDVPEPGGLGGFTIAIITGVCIAIILLALLWLF
jgi:hypothetical protein